MQVIIPMAGDGRRVWNHYYPKPLMCISGKTMIERAVNSLGIDAQYTFVVRLYDNGEYNARMHKILNRTIDNANIVTVDYLTDGPAVSALIGCRSSNFDLDDELIIANCDQIMEWDSNEFLKHVSGSNLDGVVVTYPETTSKNSYIELDENGLGIRVAEKNPISEHSLNGIHYWKRGHDFYISIKHMMDAKDTTNNEYYIGPSYNYLINSGYKIGIYPIKSEQHWPVGTADDIRAYSLHKDMEVIGESS